MAFYTITAGTTSQIIEFPIFDSSSTTGGLKSGLTYSSMTAYYHLWNAAASASMSLVTMTSGTWTSLGFVYCDNTNMLGIYQLGVPNAAIASGPGVTIYLTATGCVPVVISIQLSPVPANATQILGTAVSSPATGGVLDVNIKNIANAAVATGSAQIGVNLVNIGGSAVATGTAQLGVNVVNIAGQAAALDAQNLLKVDVEDWKGTALPAQATAGVPDVNVKNMNNVAATSITTVNANQGTTQPLNFTGTAGSALVKVDVTDIATAAVATGSAQLGVNVVNIAGQAAALDANNLLKVDCVDWAGGAIPSPNVTGTPKVDLVDISGSAVSTSTAQLGVNAVQIGAAVPGSATIGTVTNLTNAPGAGDFTSTMKSSIDTEVTNQLNAAIPASPTAGSLFAYIQSLKWALVNKMAITDANGNTVGYKDDDSTQAFSVSAMFTDNSTTTTRLRPL